MYRIYRRNTMPPSRVNTVLPGESGLGENTNRNTERKQQMRPPRFNFGRSRPCFENDGWLELLNHYKPRPGPRPRPRPDSPEDPEEPEDLEPEDPPEPIACDVDLRKKANKVMHHTADFCKSIFAVRRGQEFTIQININRRFRPKRDDLALTFAIGSRPQASKNTLVRVDVDNRKPEKEADPLEWTAYIVKREAEKGKSELTVSVRAAADCPVGKYSLRVAYYRQGKKEMKRATTDVPEGIFILFNAWCKDDQVYMESEAERKEYVLNQTGIIYKGSGHKPSGKPWNFGQFSKVTLETAVLLLDRSLVVTSGHGNPTLVTRAISAKVNSSDNDQGVLTGNWSGNYEGGTSPLKWTGSVQIFKEYLENLKNPNGCSAVKFGQCWVFSALVTSVSRCLGIPARSVTNFDSAHDTDGSLTIDYHVDEDGDKLPWFDDSVWNFHVWNDAWFKRPDLPDGFDGWQAFDATPQEASGGFMQCGPASLNAIKNGHMNEGYDTGFIYAEVNGERMYWEVGNEGEYRLISVDKYNKVGSKISTKQVGLSDRNDITLEYKYPEGSQEEIEATKRALKFTGADKRKQALAAKYGKDTPSDVTFDYTSEVMPNGNIKAEISATNKADAKRDVVLGIRSFATYYTGSTGEELTDQEINIQLEPGQRESKVWSLKAKDYLNEINDDAMVKISVTCKVPQTGQIFIQEETFPIPKPDLLLKVSNETPKVGEEITVTMSFNNPLELELTKGIFTLEGPGILKPMQTKLDKPVKVGATVEEKVKVTPKYAGVRELVAAFNSRQLVDITGSVRVTVNESE